MLRMRDRPTAPTLAVAMLAAAPASAAASDEAACDFVRPGFQRAVTKTLTQWRTNPIRAYRLNVPPDAPAEAGAVDPADAARKLAPHLSMIGARMQAESMSLLNDAAQAVLEPLLSADRAKVDGPARMAELERAKRDGSLYCGLETVQMRMN